MYVTKLNIIKQLIINIHEFIDNIPFETYQNVMESHKRGRVCAASIGEHFHDILVHTHTFYV